MYRPNFCAECGAKIFRLKWHLWTNRRFCDGCAPAFIRTQAFRVALAVFIVFVFGVVIGRTTRRAEPPLIIQRNSIPASDTTNRPDPRTSPNNVAATVEAEDVYTCGARTKKGTPCSRRVHGPVRCWQHKGMPAMLPQEKLRVAG